MSMFTASKSPGPSVRKTATAPFSLRPDFVQAEKTNTMAMNAEARPRKNLLVFIIIVFRFQDYGVPSPAQLHRLERIPKV
jgi:hypothetical protein